MSKILSKEEAIKALDVLNEEYDSRASDLMEIINAPEQTGLWKPQKGEAYWTLDSGGEAFGAMATYKASARAAYGLVFPSKDIAQKAAPLLARSNKWIAAAFQADPDAGEWAEDRRWTLVTNCVSLEIIQITYDWGYGWTYVHTREQVEKYRQILIAEGLGK